MADTDVRPLCVHPLQYQSAQTSTAEDRPQWRSGRTSTDRYSGALRSTVEQIIPPPLNQRVRGSSPWRRTPSHAPDLRLCDVPVEVGSRSRLVVCPWCVMGTRWVPEHAASPAATGSLIPARVTGCGGTGGRVDDSAVAVLRADDAALSKPAQLPRHGRWGCTDQQSELVLGQAQHDLDRRLSGPTWRSMNSQRMWVDRVRAMVCFPYARAPPPGTPSAWVTASAAQLPARLILSGGFTVTDNQQRHLHQQACRVPKLARAV